jgi:hypothetical protein
VTTNATTAISSATNYLAKINDLSTFPIPGVDNDSQGFRDQWANIHGAIKAVNEGVKDLNINAIKTNETTSFYGNTIKDVNLENSSVTLVELPLQTEDIIIDYAAGGYQAMSITAGLHNLNVINWPGAASGNSGRLTLVVTPDDVIDTSINFSNDKFRSLDSTSTGSSVIYNLYPGTNMFELWSEESVSNRDPRYFVKQVGYNASTSTNWNKIGANTYSTSTTAETIVSSNGQLGSIALVPNVVVKLYNQSPDFGSYAFKVDSTTGISTGALIYIGSTSTKFVVGALNTVTNYVTPTAPLPYTSMTLGDQITFVNPTFTGQNLALNLTSTLPTATTSSTRELKGQVYANTSTAFIIFADADAGLINKIQISGDNSGNPRALGSSTATTQPVGTTSTVVATAEFVYNFVNSSTTFVARATTASYATTATYAVNAVYATTASSMVLGTNGFGARTVSYSAPTGGVDGDIWYQII